MLLSAYGAQASSTRCRVSGWQERWQINYHVPSVKRRTDRYGSSVQSSILGAKVELISDKKFPFDNKSLFDTVPLPDPFSWLRSGFDACRLNRREKSTAKEL
jgi:hypothetical protein